MVFYETVDYFYILSISQDLEQVSLIKGYLDLAMAVNLFLSNLS